MKKYKWGFTLLELLAAVMIVAVLTAAAMPQYRKAVRRAQAAEGLSTLRSIYDSAKRYKAAYSQPPEKLNGLDVQFDDASSQEDDIFFLGNFKYRFLSEGVSACRADKGGYCFKFFYNHDTLGRDALLCIPQAISGSGSSEPSQAGISLCESMATKNGSLYVIE